MKELTAYFISGAFVVIIFVITQMVTVSNVRIMIQEQPFNTKIVEALNEFCDREGANSSWEINLNKLEASGVVTCIYKEKRSPKKATDGPLEFTTYAFANKAELENSPITFTHIDSPKFEWQSVRQLLGI